MVKSSNFYVDLAAVMLWKLNRVIRNLRAQSKNETHYLVLSLYGERVFLCMV